MSDDASSSVADVQGKNFRTPYYESLLFRGDEEEKRAECLESLLKAECIDVEALKRCCQEQSLPPYHRLQVWNIILGVVPPYNDEDTCSHVSRQREQQFMDLRRALLISLTTPLHHHTPHNLTPIQHHHTPHSLTPSHHSELKVAYTKDSHKPLTPEQLVLMYLLQGSHLPTSDSVSEARVQHKDSIPLARVFIDVCETDREAYWLFARFSKMVDRIDKDMLKSCCFHYVEKEDSSLCAHIRSLAEGIPFTLWFKQCYASTLPPEYCLEGVWDRLIGGCVMILVFLAVAILITFKRRLLGARTIAAVAEVLTQIPEDNCILIVMKAVELWEANGRLLLPQHSIGHNNH